YIGPTKTHRRISTARVQGQAAEYDKASCFGPHWFALEGAEISDPIVRGWIIFVRHTAPDAAFAHGQDVDGAIFLCDIVKRTPTGNVGLVIDVAVHCVHVAGILMPRKPHSGPGTLYNERIKEKIRVGTDKRFADRAHRLSKKIL